jgi:hypothetical protein
MAGNLHRQLETAPISEFVERVAEMILDDLLGRAHQVADLPIRKTLPNQGGYLNLFGVDHWRGIMTSTPLSRKRHWPA